MLGIGPHSSFVAKSFALLLSYSFTCTVIRFNAQLFIFSQLFILMFCYWFSCSCSAICFLDQLLMFSSAIRFVANYGRPMK